MFYTIEGKLKTRPLPVIFSLPPWTFAMQSISDFHHKSLSSFQISVHILGGPEDIKVMAKKKISNFKKSLVKHGDQWGAKLLHQPTMLTGTYHSPIRGIGNKWNNITNENIQLE